MSGSVQVIPSETNRAGHCVQLARPAESAYSPLSALHGVHDDAASPHATYPNGQIEQVVDSLLLVVPTAHEMQAVSAYSIDGSEDCRFPAMHCSHDDVLDAAALPMEHVLQVS